MIEPLARVIADEQGEVLGLLDQDRVGARVALLVQAGAEQEAVTQAEKNEQRGERDGPGDQGRRPAVAGPTAGPGSGASDPGTTAVCSPSAVMTQMVPTLMAASIQEMTSARSPR